MTPPTRLVTGKGRKRSTRYIPDGTHPITANRSVGGVVTPPYESMLDIFRQYRYNVVNAKQIRLRGAGWIRLRVSLPALTREPDTASTVGGKDQNTEKGIALHPGRVCGAIIYLWKL